jgi:DNA-directed RNA polymerase specialized sigma24 family protein
MPSRQRRAGYEPGRQLSPELEAALDAEAARLAAIEDPVEAIRSVTELFIALDDALEPVGEPRLRAISQLYRTSRSYQTVADATGLSKSRVGQLIRLARRRGF